MMIPSVASITRGFPTAILTISPTVRLWISCSVLNDSSPVSFLSLMARLRRIAGGKVSRRMNMTMSQVRPVMMSRK